MYNYITDHTATFKLSFLAITNTITRFKYSDQIMKKRGEKLIMELIEIKGSGLTCDNKNCDYVDKTVLHTNLASFINKPCPKCNENLLTLEDYQLNVKALEVIDSINKNYGDRDNSSDTKELDKYINASISCHENIKIVFGDKNV